MKPGVSTGPLLSIALVLAAVWASFAYLDMPLGALFSGAAAGEHHIERLGLGHGAREAVEDGAAGGLGLGQPFLDQGDDDLVGDQVAARQNVLHLFAKLGTGGDRRPQHVAGRKLDHAACVDQTLGLGALAASRRAEQDQVHGSPLARL